MHRMADVSGAQNGASVNVAIADDHGVVRGGLRLLLHQQEGFHVIGEAEDVPGTLRLCEARRPDVLVLDLNMPGGSSIDAIPRIRESWPGTRVVVLTMQDDPSYARAALQAGADGYVLKEAAESELVNAVRQVAAGHTYLNPELGARLAPAPAEPARPDPRPAPPRRPDRPRDRGPAADRARPHQQRDRRATVPVGAHGRDPSRAHP